MTKSVHLQQCLDALTLEGTDLPDVVHELFLVGACRFSVGVGGFFFSRRLGVISSIYIYTHMYIHIYSILSIYKGVSCMYICIYMSLFLSLSLSLSLSVSLCIHIYRHTSYLYVTPICEILRCRPRFEELAAAELSAWAQASGGLVEAVAESQGDLGRGVIKRYLATYMCKYARMLVDVCM